MEMVGYIIFGLYATALLPGCRGVSQSSTKPENNNYCNVTTPQLRKVSFVLYSQ
jgi:hypothetical protein